MVAVAGTLMQAALVGVSVTAMRGDGAEIELPPLRSSTANVGPKVALRLTVVGFATSCAFVVATMESVTQPGALAEMVAAPGSTPESVALASVCPAATNTLGVVTPTREGSL